MNSTTRIITTTAPEYPQVWALREQVLRQPLGLSLKNEDLSGDANDTIIIALQEDTVKGCIMLHWKDNNIVKFRQMAVAPEMQQTGIGRLLVHAAEAEAVQRGYTKVELHARITAAGFYEKLNYNRIGDIFTEVNIPHVLMIKNLS